MELAIVLLVVVLVVLISSVVIVRQGMNTRLKVSAVLPALWNRGFI